MKPAIVTDKDDTRLAWLVDTERAAGHYEQSSGARLLHYEVAVNLQNLHPAGYRLIINQENSAGEADFEPQALDADLAMMWELWGALPQPCVFATKRPGRFTVDAFKMGRVGNLRLPAAVVMLELAASFNAIASCSITEQFTFNGPRIERPDRMPPNAMFRPWNPWAFHCAWHWSQWELIGEQREKPLVIEERFERLKASGYPHGQKAFERMHRELFPKRRGKPTD